MRDFVDSLGRNTCNCHQLTIGHCQAI